MAKIVANEGQLSFVRINFLYPANSFYRLMLKNITAQTVNGVRRVYDHASFFQTFNDSFYVTWLGIFGMNIQHHR